MDETIKNVEYAVGRKLTEEELRVVRIAHLSAYDAGISSVWDMARQNLKLLGK